MNFVFFLIVAFLLCHGNLSRISAKIDNNQFRHINVNRNGNGRTRTKFTDIVFDVLAIILILTDVTDLMNVSVELFQHYLHYYNKIQGNVFISEPQWHPYIHSRGIYYAVHRNWWTWVCSLLYWMEPKANIHWINCSRNCVD